MWAVDPGGRELPPLLGLRESRWGVGEFGGRYLQGESKFGLNPDREFPRLEED